MASKKPVRTNKESFLSRMVDEGADRLPPTYAPYLRQTKPVIVAVGDGVDAVWPYCVMGYTASCNAWVALQPYNPQQFFPVLAGLAMCFFGGSYLMLIAAVEAIRLSVWERLSISLQVLYKNYSLALDANEKDNFRDDDGDGVADVDQISNKELFTRKVFVLAKAVNPEQVSEAAGALWTGFLSVLAATRIKFAQYITLGCAMGDMARENLGPKLQPLVRDALPPELKKWDSAVVRQLFATMGVMLAMFLQQVVGGFHAAVRGSQMATVNAILLAKKYGFLAEDFDEKSQSVNAAAMVLAFFGFFWQLRNGFAVPFPLNILLLPASIVEFILSVGLTIGL